MLQKSSDDTPPVAEPDTRLTDLRRMRAIATLLLVLMTTVFLITFWAKADLPWVPYVRAFAEAAMVGACADWFAIVALFRRPFGLPIPHTGIIPANHHRLGEALGRFISNNFLTHDATSRKLIEIDIAGSIARWLSDPTNTRRLAEYGARLLPEVVTNLPPHRVSEIIASLSRRGIESVPAAPMASRVLETLWMQGKTQSLLDSAVEKAREWLLNHKDYIQQSITKKSSRWMLKFVDGLLAERIMTGLLTTIEEMRNPSHPWRIELRNAVEKLIVDLAHDPAMAARGEALKAELLANPTFTAQMDLLATRIEEGLYADVDRYTETLSTLLESALRGLADWLHDDPELPASINRRIRIIAVRLLTKRRMEIGAYIAHVVQNWDTTTLVNKLELQVGKDLQYIRINGTLVGGLVGLVIFTVTQLLENS
jgi:uncharacterized membrane-anchored protein YjiN (DUF445 family)